MAFKDKLISRLFLLCVCILCLLAYIPSLDNEFVFDDQALVVHNPFIKSVKLLPKVFGRGIYDHWTGAGSYDRMYRPLQVLSYWVDYRVWGLRPLGFRLTNILLHLFNSILIYYLLFLLFKGNTVLPFAAILFFIHPLNYSLACYISARADLLSCLFIVLSLIFFLKSIRGRRPLPYILSLIAAASALICRENSVILFLFIILIIMLERPARPYALIAPFILLNILYIILRFFVFGPSGLFIHPEILSFPLRLVNFFNVVFRYMLLLSLPLDLRLFRAAPFINSLFSLNTLIVSAGVLSGSAVLIKLRKNKLVIFSVFWFLIGLAPALFLLDAYPMFGRAMMAESWVYLSSIGFFILFCYALARFKKTGLILIGVFTCFYAALAAANGVYWKNNLLIHERALRYGQEPNPLRKDLIDDYLEAGLYQKAFQQAKVFNTYYPAGIFSDIIWGNYYFSVGRAKRALENYSAALAKAGRDNFFLYYRISLCYKLTGDDISAIIWARKSFDANPYFEPNLNNLERLYGKITG